MPRSSLLQLNRRHFLQSLGIAIGMGVAGSASSSSRPPSVKSTAPHLILLGTGGGPIVGSTRSMAGNVVVANGRSYLVDCGYGVAGQMARAGVDFTNLSSVFVTHHHPDHNLELGTVLTIAWLYGRTRPISVYGPPGTHQMISDYRHMVKPTSDAWISDVKTAPYPDIRATDLSVGGPVMEDENVRVVAAVVQHPPIVPAFAYRFECQGRSVVFSGDTAPCDAMINISAKADVLVHEAMDATAIESRIRADYERAVRTGDPNAALYRPEPWIDHMRRSHSSAVEVGRMAAQAGVKTLVLSHFVPGDGRVTEAMWRDAAAKHFRGRIIVGRDLMVIPL